MSFYTVLLAKDPKQMDSDCKRDKVWRKKVSMLEAKIVDVFLFLPSSWVLSSLALGVALSFSSKY
jgi:hypothetical protein